VFLNWNRGISRATRMRTKKGRKLVAAAVNAAGGNAHYLDLRAGPTDGCGRSHRDMELRSAHGTLPFVRKLRSNSFIYLHKKF
jgi:hypothetical protein